SPEVKALIANYATHGQVPPWQSGAGYLPMLITAAHRGTPARPRGGSGAFITSLLDCLRSMGGEVLTGCGVTRVPIRHGRATGVELETGEFLRATRAVISSVDARRLFLDLLSPDNVPQDLLVEVRRIRVAAHNVGEMSMGLALDGLPNFGPELCGPALSS